MDFLIFKGKPQTLTILMISMTFEPDIKNWKFFEINPNYKILNS